MNVAIVGAGALGSVYGVRMAALAAVAVTFVVRPERALETTPIAIESIRTGDRRIVETPIRAAALPPDTDAIIVAVGTDDLDGLGALLGDSDAPIVILTPMMPQDWARVRAAFGTRALAAMPNVIAYERDGIVRYWRAPAPTRIDERDDPALRELVRALRRAGFRPRLELAVHETNPATTVCYVPIAMALAAAGSVKGLLASEPLRALVARACREGVRLSRRLGRAEPWAVLAPALAGPSALALFFRALARFEPEALTYADDHFARKLRAQHLRMIEQMIELAREKHLPGEAMRELALLLR